MDLRHVSANVRGRLLYERRDPARLLVGFHGYAQTAEIHMADLQRIEAVEEWSVAAVQALHPFYTRSETTGASWMTRQDREIAMADNIDYVRRAVGSLPRPETLVFLGFSQGVAMAYRAAADFAWRCHGLIALGGDVPPDVAQEGVHLPPVLLARGKEDDWYTAEKLEKDLRFLRGATDLTTCLFEGGHEWSDEFRAAAGRFLASF
ncbi:MAG TPA: phospholipase [Thermoanaerobaculia bacterium]|nr:phospholipase [Thermoanaerobaculia bacterium]